MRIASTRFLGVKKKKREKNRYVDYQLSECKIHFAGQSIRISLKDGLISSVQRIHFKYLMFLSLGVISTMEFMLVNVLADPKEAPYIQISWNRWQEARCIISVPKMDNVAPSNKRSFWPMALLMDLVNFRSINWAINSSREMLQKMKLRGASIY